VTTRHYTLQFRPAAVRIRVGDFRVVYTISDEALVVTVVRVANRRQVYRGL
jgi:mRNA interferase RelE/StbE